MDKDIISEGLIQLRNINKLNDIIEGITNNQSKISALEFTMYMRNQLLRDSDWAGMAHSLEIRVPFVDKILFEQSISILSKNKSLNKSQIFSKISNLDKEYFNRKKTGFSFSKVNQIQSNEKTTKNEIDQNKKSSKIIISKYKNFI
jgi:asparagine synthase (glutamine-hydrolysing)